MTNPTVRIHDQETDQIIEREMTPEEIAFIDETIAEFDLQQTAKVEAKAKLETLGLTPDDLKALGL